MFLFISSVSILPVSLQQAIASYLGELGRWESRYVPEHESPYFGTRLAIGGPRSCQTSSSAACPLPSPPVVKVGSLSPPRSISNLSSLFVCLLISSDTASTMALKNGLQAVCCWMLIQSTGISPQHTQPDNMLEAYAAPARQAPSSRRK